MSINVVKYLEKPASHQLDIIDHCLDLAVAKNYAKNIFILPPGHGKTTIARTVALCYADYIKGSKVSVVTHRTALAEMQGREVLKTFDLPAVRSTCLQIGVGQSEIHYQGIGTNLVGWRYDLVIVDDPIGNREEAMSPSHLLRLNSWLNDIRMKLKPGGSMLVLQSRWHKFDTSFLLKAWDFREAIFPAISNGKALWEDQQSLSYLEEVRSSISPEMWETLYLGRA